MNGWLKFNCWAKSMPITSKNMKIFVNAGDHRLKQRYKSCCLNADALNRFGKMPECAKISNAMRRAITAWQSQCEPDIIMDFADLSKHGEPCVGTELGIFAITDIATICGVNVGEDGLWLVTGKKGVTHAFFYNCNKFFKFHL